MNGVKGNKKVIIIAVIIVAVLIWGVFALKKANAPADSISPEIGFVGYSPFGAKGGAIVPASCESGYSHAGECVSAGGGSLGTGSIPPTPQCPCNSAANSCGMRNPGFGACGGVCPVPSPSDNSCSSPSLSIGSIITTGTGTINSPLSSQTVNRGQRCTIYWNANPATRCTVTGPGLNYSGGITGQIQTPPIEATSVFRITCYNGRAVSASKNFTCRLNPDFEETR